MKIIALIWATLLFTGSMHACTGQMSMPLPVELTIVQTCIDSKEVTETHSCCHSESDEDSEDSCCSFGVCSCMIVHFTEVIEWQEAIQLSNYQSLGFVSTDRLTSEFSGDIFQPPKSA